MIKITLSNGGQAVVDDEDYFMNNWKWTRSNKGYAQRGIKIKDENGIWKGTTILMHRAIMSAKKGQQLDHINGNPLDNRKSNLRFSTQKQNLRNQKLSKNNKTGFKGVTNFNGKYRALIQIDGKNKHLGLFKTAEEASAVYNIAAFKADPEFWKLN